MGTTIQGKCFVEKLALMLLHEPPQLKWNADGNGILIENYYTFSTSILPLYFKHDNFRSFIRQLNLYNFQKVSRDDTIQEFVNASVDFYKGNEVNFKNIQRHTNKHKNKNLLYCQMKQNEIINLLEIALNDAHVYKTNMAEIETKMRIMHDKMNKICDKLDTYMLDTEKSEPGNIENDNTSQNSSLFDDNSGIYGIQQNANETIEFDF